jgi:N,N'-diacetyl-8-epilegionaminate cytidylyltransferase
MHSQWPRTIGFVFARGGSKGLPGKNIKLLAGKPLIGYAIETALACKRLETVIVSTDDPQIAAVAREFGAETPFMRPAELASDTAPEWQSWQHAIRLVQAERGLFDVFVSLPATSPFRIVADVDACLDTLVRDPETDVVVTVREATRSPYFSMVGLDESGFAHLILEPPWRIERRQDAPTVYEMTTVAYVTRPSFVLNASRIFDGRVRTVPVPQERALDIDTAYDFMLAECIARGRLGRSGPVPGNRGSA